MERTDVRSEAVRKIIKQPLPPLLRWGTVGVAVIVLLLLLAAFLLPLPHKESLPGQTFVERLWQGK